jgi:hypothetical protein
MEVKPIKQIITPQSQLEAEIMKHVANIKNLFGLQYNLTLLARNNTGKEGVDMLVSEDTDLDNLIAAITKLKEARKKNVVYKSHIPGNA